MAKISVPFIAQLERRVGQRIGDAERAQARA